MFCKCFILHVTTVKHLNCPHVLCVNCVVLYFRFKGANKTFRFGFGFGFGMFVLFSAERDGQQ